MKKWILTAEHKCVKCGNSYADINYIIENRGFGSIFDCVLNPTVIPVCYECAEKHLEDKWFYENPTIDGYTEVYKYEDDIMDFIQSLTEDESDKVLRGYYT